LSRWRGEVWDPEPHPHRRPLPNRKSRSCFSLGRLRANHAGRKLKLLFAIPNGLRTSIRVAVKAKRAGLNAGVPDICLPVPQGGYHSLFIELKRVKGGRLSPRQRGWLRSLQNQGYRCVIAPGFDAAKPGCPSDPTFAHINGRSQKTAGAVKRSATWRSAVSGHSLRASRAPNPRVHLCYVYVDGSPVGSIKKAALTFIQDEINLLEVKIDRMEEKIDALGRERKR
jgi:hypothetical protein